MAGDVQAPPWLLIGMEGFFGARLLHERRLPARSRCRTPGSLSLSLGTLLCTLVVYPIAQASLAAA